MAPLTSLNHILSKPRSLKAGNRGILNRDRDEQKEKCRFVSGLKELSFWLCVGLDMEYDNKQLLFVGCGDVRKCVMFLAAMLVDLSDLQAVKCPVGLGGGFKCVCRAGNRSML